MPANRAFIARHGLDADLVFTERHGQATDLARAAGADGCEQVVAVRGDGTMNEVAQALVGAPAVLAFVSCGSGNGLALHLGVPAQPRRALVLLVDLSARVVNIATGTANGHPFFNAMGAGFDAEISRRFNRLARRGMVAYQRAGLATFAHYRGERVALSDGNGRRETMDAFLVVVTNSNQYGNHARMAPGARVDDGLLDLVVVPPPGATVEVVVRPCSLRLVVPAACVVAAAGPPPFSPPFPDDGGYARYVRLALKKLEKRSTEVLYESSSLNSSFLPVTAVTSACAGELSVLFRLDPGVSARS